MTGQLIYFSFFFFSFFVFDHVTKRKPYFIFKVLVIDYFESP